MKILMVCLGNICRSPMAEGVLRHIIEKKNLFVEIDSCGTASYHVGEPPDIRAQEAMKKHGIDILSLRARQLIAADLNNFDRIYAMDNDNYNDIFSLANNENSNKVSLILNRTEYPGGVPDPYYGGQSGFEDVYYLLNDACTLIADSLE